MPRNLYNRVELVDPDRGRVRARRRCSRSSSSASPTTPAAGRSARTAKWTRTAHEGDEPRRRPAGDDRSRAGARGRDRGDRTTPVLAGAAAAPYWRPDAPRRARLLDRGGRVSPTGRLARRSTGTRRADVSIVGGGYTGMWAAWWIKRRRAGRRRGPARGGPLRLRAQRPQRRVRQLDVVQPADDAGGVRRRGGARRRPRRRRVDRRDRPLVRGAGRRRVVHARRLPAGLDLGSLRPQLGADRRGLRGGRGGGHGARSSTATAPHARCASPIFRAAAFYPQAATVQPARLAEGLRGSPARGGGRASTSARRCARSPSVTGRPSPTTASGTVTAGSAVLAAGGSLLRFRPLRRALTATSSHMVITEPVPDLIEELGWSGGECITDSRAMVHYFRTTRDGRIAFGWGGGRIVARRPARRPCRRRPGDGRRGRDAPPPVLPAARRPGGRPTPGAGRSTSHRRTCR